MKLLSQDRRFKIFSTKTCGMNSKEPLLRFAVDKNAYRFLIRLFLPEKQCNQFLWF